MRTLLGGLFAMVIFAGNLQAAEVKGKIKTVDADKGVITLAGAPALPGGSIAGTADTDYLIGKEAKIVDQTGKEIKDGLKAAVLKPGVMVTFTRENKNGTLVITQVKVWGDPVKR